MCPKKANITFLKKSDGEKRYLPDFFLKTLVLALCVRREGTARTKRVVKICVTPVKVRHDRHTPC